MNLKYLIKEAKYYWRRDGSPKKAIVKFLLYKTPLSRLVNTRFYNYFYKKRIDRCTRIYKPSILQIENTNFCNAKCIMCPHVMMKRKQKIMNLEDFKKILDSTVKSYPSIKLLVITGFGDPLVDKGLIEKIDYANKNYPKLKIDIYTNAGLLTKELADNLLKRKLHKINFSINALQKDYKKIMGLDYELVSKNINYFTDRKKQLKKAFPLINFSFMILKENASDIKKFIELWQKKGDSVMTYMPLDWTGNKKVETLKESRIKKKRWACMALWQTIMIDVEGNVIMCCMDYESKVKFGNILKSPLRDIMRSKHLEKIKELHKKGIFSMPLCDKCDTQTNSSFGWWEYS